MFISILITKSFNLQLFTLILYGLRVRCDVDIFKLTASAQSINREVYDINCCVRDARATSRVTWSQVTDMRDMLHERHVAWES